MPLIHKELGSLSGLWREQCPPDLICDAYVVVRLCPLGKFRGLRACRDGLGGPPRPRLELADPDRPGAQRAARESDGRVSSAGRSGHAGHRRDRRRTAPLEPCRRLTALGGLLAHPSRDDVSQLTCDTRIR